MQSYSNSMYFRGHGFNQGRQAHVNAGRFRQQRNFLARFNPVSRINRIAQLGIYVHVHDRTVQRGINKFVVIS